MYHTDHRNLSVYLHQAPEKIREVRKGFMLVFHRPFTSNWFKIDVGSDFYFSVVVSDYCEAHQSLSPNVTMELIEAAFVSCSSLQIIDDTSKYKQLPPFQTGLISKQLKANYYAFFFFFQSMKYDLKFVHSQSCNLKDVSTSVNISHVVGYNNVVRWEQLQEYYMVVHCYKVPDDIGRLLRHQYLPYVTIERKATTDTHPTTHDCAITVNYTRRIARVRTTIDGEQYDIHTPSNNFFQFRLPYGKSDHILPPPWRHMLNLTWREALEICQGRGIAVGRYIQTDIFDEANLFTYLSERELMFIIARMEFFGLAGGPLLIFTGFTTKQVSTH